MIIAGLLFDITTGRVQVQEVVPVTFSNAGGFSVEGYLAITFAAVDANSVYNGGLAFTPNGRLHATVTSNSDDVFIQGVRVSAQGAVVVSGS